VYLAAAQSLSRKGYLRWDDYEGCNWQIAYIGDWLRGWESYQEELERHNIAELRAILDIEIWINPGNHEVIVLGKKVDLARMEFNALFLLCTHGENLVTRDLFADELWPDNRGAVTNAQIDAIIYRLRNKLGKAGDHIETIPGQGFIVHKAAFIQAE
jgi:DNA-binding winged helix-turn-helix (wHTH) protein